MPDNSDVFNDKIGEMKNLNQIRPSLMNFIPSRKNLKITESSEHNNILLMKSLHYSKNNKNENSNSKSELNIKDAQNNLK